MTDKRSEQETIMFPYICIYKKGIAKYIKKKKINEQIIFSN